MTRKVNVRLPGKVNSNSHGARPTHLIITMIKWIRTSKLSIKNCLSAGIAKLAVTAIVSSWAEEEPTKSIMASEAVSKQLQERVTHLLNAATVIPTAHMMGGSFGCGVNH